MSHLDHLDNPGRARNFGEKPRPKNSISRTPDLAKEQRAALENTIANAAKGRLRVNAALEHQLLDKSTGAGIVEGALRAYVRDAQVFVGSGIRSYNVVRGPRRLDKNVIDFDVRLHARLINTFDSSEVSIPEVLYGERSRQSPRTIQVVDDLIARPDLCESMKRVAILRRERRPWTSEWARIRSQVYDLSNEAEKQLGSLGVKEVELTDGVVSEVTISALDFLRCGSELIQRAPRLRHLHLTDYDGANGRLFDSALLRSIVSLDLRDNQLTDRDVKRLVECPYLVNIYWLNLGDNLMTERSLSLLVKAPFLDRVVFMGLDGNEFDNPIDQVVEDSGEIVSTSSTTIGLRLEREAPTGRLPWLHSPRNFGHLYPPLPSDAEALAQEILCGSLSRSGTYTRDGVTESI